MLNKSVMPTNNNNADDNDDNNINKLELVLMKKNFNPLISKN